MSVNPTAGLTSSTAALSASRAQDRVEPRGWALVLTLLALALIPRLWVYPVNENLFGDAVARTELAVRWAQAPHWIESFSDGAYQFGPLHIYLIGLVLKLWSSPEHAGRLVSLVFGVLAVFPLFSLTRRFFGWEAGMWAALGFGLWGMHMQMATTAGSEALSLFLVLSALVLFAPGIELNQYGPLCGSAALLNLACATRYDNWLLMPLLAGLLLFTGKDRVAGMAKAVLFGFLCLPFPAVWMQGNELAHGDPFYPVSFIDQFHREWFIAGAGAWGELGYRAQNLFFWPATAVVTLSPLLAFWGILGMVRVYKERPELRWLLWVSWAPALYFTFRAVVMGSFSPLARFTVTQVALVLPFVGYGFQRWMTGRPPGARRLWAGATVVVAVALPLALGLFTFRREGKVEDALRPISPTSTNPPALMALARRLKTEVPAAGAVLVDTSPRFLDLQLAFYSRLPDRQVVRYRWGDLAERVDKAQPTHVVLLEGGTLRADPLVQAQSDRLRIGDQWFSREPSPPSYALYRVVR